MTRILGLSGSLRKASYNAGLLRAARTLHPDHIEIGSIADLPLYNADVEAAGFPAAVEALKQRLARADGLLLVTPEYNNSLPGVTKNAIDWLSRPSGDIANVFRDKPVAIIGASPGGFGTILSQSAWLPVFRTLRAQLWTSGRLMVSGAKQVFDEESNLADPDIRKRLDEFIGGFIAFCKAYG
jgi:NAD(P)H-dependent FMN reductase